MAMLISKLLLGNMHFPHTSVSEYGFNVPPDIIILQVCAVAAYISLIAEWPCLRSFLVQLFLGQQKRSATIIIIINITEQLHPSCYISVVITVSHPLSQAPSYTAWWMMTEEHMHQWLVLLICVFRKFPSFIVFISFHLVYSVILFTLFYLCPNSFSTPFYREVTPSMSCTRRSKNSSRPTKYTAAFLQKAFKLTTHPRSFRLRFNVSISATIFFSSLSLKFCVRSWCWSRLTASVIFVSLLYCKPDCRRTRSASCKTTRLLLIHHRHNKRSDDNF